MLLNVPCGNSATDIFQASRRAWRIIQTEACRTYYPFYEGSMEARAVALIGRKQRAAKLLYGENDAGLSDLTGGDDAGDLIAELAKSLDGDDSITDLRDLFKAASSAEEARESLWATDEPEPIIAVAEEVELEPEPAILIQNWPQRLPEPLDRPQPKPKRRRKASLSDAPKSLPLFEDHSTDVNPYPAENLTQLPLF